MYGLKPKCVSSATRVFAKDAKEEKAIEKFAHESFKVVKKIHFVFIVNCFLSNPVQIDYLCV